VILVLENERDLDILAALLGPFGRPMPGVKWDDDLDKGVVDGPPVQSDPGDENDCQAANTANTALPYLLRGKCTCGASDGACPTVGCAWAHEQKRRQQAQMQSDHEPPPAEWHGLPHIPRMVREVEGDDEIAALVRKVQDLNATSIVGAERRRHVDHAEYYASRAQ
jgi:hypothetical protein